MFEHLNPYTQIEIKKIVVLDVPGMYEFHISQRHQDAMIMNLNRDQIFNLVGNLINNSHMSMEYVGVNGDQDGNVTCITKNTDNEQLRIHFIDFYNHGEQCYEYKSFDEFIDDIISYVGDRHGTIQFRNQ